MHKNTEPFVVLKWAFVQAVYAALEGSGAVFCSYLVQCVFADDDTEVCMGSKTVIDPCVVHTQ